MALLANYTDKSDQYYMIDRFLKESSKIEVWNQFFKKLELKNHFFNLHFLDDSIAVKFHHPNDERCNK